MRLKHRLLKVSVLTLMVFSLMVVVSGTLAFWGEDIVESNDTATATVETGEWDQVFQWDPDASYSDGDIVKNNGNRYEARGNNPFIEPGQGFLWWLVWRLV